MDLNVEFGLMGIIKMINGSDHDFEGIMIFGAKWIEELINKKNKKKPSIRFKGSENHV